MGRYSPPDPTPCELKLRAAEVQSRWSPFQRLQRMGYTQPEHWTAPVINELGREEPDLFNNESEL